MGLRRLWSVKASCTYLPSVYWDLDIVLLWQIISKGMLVSHGLASNSQVPYD